MEIDHELIQMARKGNRKAMHTLYDLTVRYLYTICQRYVGNEQDVQDVMQESYIKIFRGISECDFSNAESLRSWMAKITVNESLAFLRRKEKDMFIFSDDEIPDIEEEIETSRFSPEELQNAIRQLPTGYRVILNLYVFEQMSHKQIAETLGIKENSSASQFSRAKVMLGKILVRQEGEQQ